MNVLDRDLLVLEPGLFRDVRWAGQVIARGAGEINETRISTEEPSVQWVRLGMVTIIADTMYEVVDVSSGIGLSVLRARASDLETWPLVSGPVNFAVLSFGPQIEQARQEVLGLLGLRAGPSALGPGGRRVLGEDALMDPGALKLLVSYGALRIIYAAAGTLLGDSSPAAQRARAYQRLFAAERWRVAAEIDADGDGIGDAIRRPSVMTLVRA
jgi:hypothetical protein